MFVFASLKASEWEVEVEEEEEEEKEEEEEAKSFSCSRSSQKKHDSSFVRSYVHDEKDNEGLMVTQPVDGRRLCHSGHREKNIHYRDRKRDCRRRRRRGRPRSSRS
jgi:hypothetical protein